MKINPEYILTEQCLCIINSYKVRKWNMTPFLKRVRKESEGETRVFERSMYSLKKEWICHNFGYMIGYERERTKHCDLDNPCDRPEWQYIVLGTLLWPFVW